MQGETRRRGGYASGGRRPETRVQPARRRFAAHRVECAAGADRAGRGMECIGALRTMRLLGIHPMDAYLNDDLTSMLQACQTLDPTAGSLVSEVWNGGCLSE